MRREKLEEEGGRQRALLHAAEALLPLTQDKGAASQRKRLIKDLQERAVDTEAKTAQYEDAHKVLTTSIGAISRTIEGLAGKLKCHTQLLTEMDGFEENSGIIMLAATNRADVLDTALLRPGRFDRQILVELPDRRGREAILGVHARSRPLSDEVSMELWARRTPGFSGADLANLINEAAILTARRERTFIDEQAMHDALERVTLGMGARPLQDSAKKRLIAYHEVGHALITTLLPAADALDKLTILPRAGGIGGFARTTPDEEILDSGLISRAYLQARLVVAMGGRAAELVVFGPSEVTQGASSDLQMVTRIAREMVTRYGFSVLGPVAAQSVGLVTEPAVSQL